MARINTIRSLLAPFKKAPKADVRSAAALLAGGLVATNTATNKKPTGKLDAFKASVTSYVAMRAFKKQLNKNGANAAASLEPAPRRNGMELLRTPSTSASHSSVSKRPPLGVPLSSFSDYFTPGAVSVVVKSTAETTAPTGLAELMARAPSTSPLKSPPIMFRLVDAASESAESLSEYSPAPSTSRLKDAIARSQARTNSYLTGSDTASQMTLVSRRSSRSSMGADAAFEVSAQFAKLVDADGPFGLEVELQSASATASASNEQSRFSVSTMASRRISTQSASISSQSSSSTLVGDLANYLLPRLQFDKTTLLDALFLPPGKITTAKLATQGYRVENRPYYLFF